MNTSAIKMDLFGKVRFDSLLQIGNGFDINGFDRTFHSFEFFQSFFDFFVLDLESEMENFFR